MNCNEAEAYLSALYDGEAVPAEVAQHVAGCGECRKVLADYAQMGAEMRLAAAVESPHLPPLKLEPRTHTLAFLWKRIAVPRAALATLIAAVVLAPIGVSLLRAQSRPLWFQFAFGLDPNEQSNSYTVAKAGYDSSFGLLALHNGAPIGLNMQIRVLDLSENDAVLRVRAIAGQITPEGRLNQVKRISLDHTPDVHYRPGDVLPIPIEGGGTVYIKGQIFDHQPKIAFGYPLEAPGGQLVVRWPVLMKSHELLADMTGATSTYDKPDRVLSLGAGTNGVFRFALHPFPGAVQGEAEWGEINFKLDGEDYRLIAAAPITGGDQPAPVWVRRDPPDNRGTYLGHDKLPD